MNISAYFSVRKTMCQFRHPMISEERQILCTASEAHTESPKYMAVIVGHRRMTAEYLKTKWNLLIHAMRPDTSFSVNLLVLYPAYDY